MSETAALIAALTGRSVYGRGYGTLSPPPLPEMPVRVVLVQNDRGPSEIMCRGHAGDGCGLLMLPMVLGVEFEDPVAGTFRVDRWACIVCWRAVEVRYAAALPREGPLDA